MEPENNRYIVQVFVGALSQHYEALSVEASKQTTAEEIVSCIAERLSLTTGSGFELAEVVGDTLERECKERRLGAAECPVALMLLWPKANPQEEYYRFYLREKLNDTVWADGFTMDPQLIKDYFCRFLYQPADREYPDLCQLPDLNEHTLLDNLRARFIAGHIYTYVGSILIAVNPFKFYPIYNPKYVKLYQNRRMGPELPPHIFAVADSAYHCMLRNRRNQCIVISGESGSGKTESTNFLLHHLTALSQKGSHGSGVEQTILSAGPVLEAFGNAKTAHNNNSSRFGKFIQVNYKENGMVHGAVVQKYLLEKSRICSQGRNERNYHVFYYLLAGASDTDKQQLHLQTVEYYNYLNRSGCYVLDNVDEKYEFSRLKQSMEMVGFTAEKQRRLFSVLSAVLLLGNVEFQPRKSAYHHDEAVGVKNSEIVLLISELLRVKQETLLAALTAKRARASGETLVINYKPAEAIAARDAMAKCLYGALFDWIVLQVNHALLSKKDTLREHQGNSIGVLDIFGFEDFGLCNSFEQFCINYANEHLQHYFNQHVFKYEQEEYRKEGIKWRDIDFLDNSACLHLIEGKPNGLLCVLDDQCNFPGASNETLLQKFNSVHKENMFYEMPQKREAAFIVRHYAGKVKYQVVEMREKNLDLMRQEIVGVLKNSNMAFVRELVGADPVAVFRWAIVRAFFRGYFAFHEAGRKHRLSRDGNKPSTMHNRYRNHTPNDTILSHLVTMSAVNLTVNRIAKNKSFRPRERGKKGLKNLQSVKTLAGRTQSIGQMGKARKQPMTVTAQFQQSLHSLMDTLNQANPFFIRCIKSNSNKVANTFDDETVQRQLRYTGMLETVRIRQAGYNVRLTYDEFIQLYRILLPKGLLSSQSDVRSFLLTLNLNRDNYQVGSSKIFMRECEKVKLDYRLHQQIMASIITIQRWFRSVLERASFLKLKAAAITIQAFWRMVMVQQQKRQWNISASKIQRAWRSHTNSAWYRKLRTRVIIFQAHVRGYLVRRKIKDLIQLKLSEKQNKKEKEKQTIPKSPTLKREEPPDKTTQENFAKELNLTENFIKKERAVDAGELAESQENRTLRVGDPNKEILGVEFRRRVSPRKVVLSEIRNCSDELIAAGNDLEPTSGAHSDSEMETGDSNLWKEMKCMPPPPRLPRRRDNSTKPPNKLALGGQELKRRNSGPEPSHYQHSNASQQPTQLHSPSADLLEWKGTSMFTIAGHSFRKIGRLNKDDCCSSCLEPMLHLTHGHKCTDCKQLFHTKCIQNGGVLQLPCHPSVGSGSRKNKQSRKSARLLAGAVQASTGGSSHSHAQAKFNLQGTSEFTDSTDKIISGIKELQLMQDFITKKIYKIELAEGEKPSKADMVFKQALREFKDNLIATYSVVNKQGTEALNIKYKDLIANFSHVMETVRLQEHMRSDFPVTMGVNAFRGFMNEFMTITREEQEKPRKTKRKKDKKRKVEDPVMHAGHHFVLTIINIPTACEICSSFFMWPIERGLVCQNCKLTCHKKCYIKVVAICSKEVIVPKLCPHPVFGVPLQQLTSADEKIPLIVDRLITTIEMYFLYTEGIYRKSGVSSKVRELKARMEEGKIESIQFERYQAHVLASVLKSFLREMPEPLLTFDCYDDFLRAANLTEDKVSTMFTILKKLPKLNFDLMERLIFHLARVALHEDVNRMSSSALAIVFAPCILRTNKIVPAQDSLHDISRQTTCVEIIISEQLRKVRSTLADIDTLDTACHTATYRLSSIRSSKIFTPEELVIVKTDEEEAMLMGKIEEIQKEKALLTSTLPSLTRSPSDDDLLSTDDGSLDEVDTSNPQPLSRHRVVHKHKKRGSESSSATFYNPDCDEDPIMV
ncbi:unconventional myosin-IXb-like isoform X2 [Rhodnius prolixus]|uniref:unconventional myosin-IXb-like isoform X2 n=1 Tax=Rhodnius prolixus TaxID=13249 RepID=UPI003D18C6C8